MGAAWLIVWSVILGPDDPQLVRTIVEVQAGYASCESLAQRVVGNGRLEGNQVLEAQCVRERPKGLKQQPKGAFDA